VYFDFACQQSLCTVAPMFRPVKTPCIGICSTGLGDDVCRGCKRFAHEVTGWNGYSHEQRFYIAQRLDQFLVKIMSNNVEVFDSRLLSNCLHLQQILFDESRDPRCWVYALLKAGASQIDQPEDFGFRLLPTCRERNLIQLREEVDRQFYELSRAHYQRYVLPGLLQDLGITGG